MSQHCSDGSARQQRKIAKQVEKIDANHFFNLLTRAELLEVVETHLPDHRDRKFPPTVPTSAKQLMRIVGTSTGECLSVDEDCDPD